MEASPSAVYGARLLSGFGLIPIASSNLAASANVKAPQPRVAGPFMSPDSLGRSVEQWRERVQAFLNEVIDPADKSFTNRSDPRLPLMCGVPRRSWRSSSPRLAKAAGGAFS